MQYLNNSCKNHEHFSQVFFTLILYHFICTFQYCSCSCYHYLLLIRSVVGYYISLYLWYIVQVLSIVFCFLASPNWTFFPKFSENSFDFCRSISTFYFCLFYSHFSHFLRYFQRYLNTNFICCVSLSSFYNMIYFLVFRIILPIDFQFISTWSTSRIFSAISNIFRKPLPLSLSVIFLKPLWLYVFLPTILNTNYICCINLCIFILPIAFQLLSTLFTFISTLQYSFSNKQRFSLSLCFPHISRTFSVSTTLPVP